MAAPLMVLALGFLLFLAPPPALSGFCFAPGFWKPILLIAPFVPVAVIFFLGLLRGGYGTLGLPDTYKIPSLLVLLAMDAAITGKVERDPVDIRPTRSSPRHIVLVVDESVRADFLDLNQDRGVTPGLHRFRDRPVNFGYASAGGNCSSTSNLILRYGIDPMDFNASLDRNPSLWQYAKAAGYATVYIEAQAERGTLNNRLSHTETRLIDQFIYAEGSSEKDRDLDAARLIKMHIQDTIPRFIFVIKAGVHFPFDHRVPDTALHFHPHQGNNSPDPLEKRREALTNAYMNLVRWSIDAWFSEFLQNAVFENAVIIYTSDHGQNLLDNGLLFTHCVVENAHSHEGLVPLLAFTDIPSLRSRLKEAAELNFNRASHFAITPTLLDLMGFDPSEIVTRHGLSLFDTLPEERRFVTGVLRERTLALGPSQPIRWKIFSVDGLTR